MVKAVAVAFVVCLSFVLMSYTESVPTFRELEVPEIDVFAVDPYDDSDAFQPERADRHPRVTCDLLSVSTPWGSVNHAACAANCLRLRKGYRGGRCRDGVCHCRR